MKRIITFFNDESGLELSEYVVAAALIGLAVVTAFTNLGSAVTSAVDTLNSYIRSS